MSDKWEKCEKLGHTHLFLISVPVDSPFLPLNGDFPSLCSEIPLRLLTRKIPKAQTSNPGLEFPSQFDLRLQSLVGFAESLCTFRFLLRNFSPPNMIRALFVIRKTPSKHEFHSPHETTTHSELYKYLVRLTSKSHLPTSRIQDHTRFVTSDHAFPVLYRPVLYRPVLIS